MRERLVEKGIHKSKIVVVPTTLRRDGGIILENLDPNDIAKVVERLVNDDESRAGYALRRWRRYLANFAKDKHIDRWEELLAKL